ncbi:SDR family oxidoreductase [Achromobacter aloeverae]|uniref:Short chain dehydrogenase n=1 Tax=Achromobacter aloeverae TaxID=1750518 RepID=A0A4Q1HCM2_9BURK|nr:SDR family oxidoreductase [Achromobacter aloeverae]RXN83344.1 short chain dehydrogenase [Achromobacter aloeverae]
MTANKTFIVTGAARGIGAAITNRLLDDGHRVLAMDINALPPDHPWLRRDALRFERGDVTRADDVRSILDCGVRHFGGIDVIVNNAGIAQRKGDLLETDEAEFDRLMAVNVRSIYLFARYGVPILEKSAAPSIINVGSVIGLRPRPKLTWYSTSKGAANVMTKALAVELAPRGIRVNAVCPVATETDMLEALAGGDTEDDIAPLRASVPLGRLAKAADVSSAVAFLASEEAAFLTGVNLPVDGGRSI